MNMIFLFYSACNLFDKCLVPIVTYGSQIWGINVKNVIENVLVQFCRKQLCVGSTMLNVAVLGECGIFPVYIKCYVNVIRYWFKLVSLPEGSLLRSCYNMLYVQANAGRENWANGVKNLLYKFGFGYIWEQQSINDIGSFIRIFTGRLCDCYEQNWNSERVKLSKLSLYNMYKHDFKAEPYLQLNIPRRLRRSLAKFRTLCININIEIGRRHGIDKEHRLCPFCQKSNILKVEDEFHVLLECSAYSDLRQIYLDQVNVTLFSFCSIMKVEDVNELTRLANFISCVLEVRGQLD